MFLKDKTVVISGGGSGIGRAIALRLGCAGAQVVVCGRRQDPLDETVTELTRQGSQGWAAICDVADRESTAAFFQGIEERGQRVDVLVNNAGGSGLTSLSQPDYDLWDSIIAANINGLYYFTCEALRSIPDGGRIINISSILGKFGVPGYGAYCTSKHGVVGFTRTAALELAPRQITVNALCPGWVDTEMAQKGMEAGADAGEISYEEFRRRALRSVPLGQMIDPSEVAELVAYLAGPAARNITGQSINICGGQVMF